MKRWVLWIVAIVGAVLIVTAAVGSVMPRDHVARLAIELQAPPERVWGVVADVANAAAWRKDISAVRIEPAVNGAIRFTESSSQGDVTFDVITERPPRHRVVRIVDDDQPFGGTWTWQIEPLGTGTRLTITEAGFVKNPIFRVIGAIFFSPSDTIREYLRALAAHLGEAAEPR